MSERLPYMIFITASANPDRHALMYDMIKNLRVRIANVNRELEYCLATTKFGES